MELVHRPLQQGFGLARRPEHRVAGDPAVDPAGRIPLEQRIGDRRHEKVGPPQDVQEQLGAVALGQIADGDAADQALGQLHGRHLVEPGANGLGDSGADAEGRDAPVEHPIARRLVLQGLGEQVVQVEHFDPAFLHLQYEVEVVLASLLHPDDVVEQEVVAVARSQALVGQPGPADHDGPELAHFRVDAELPFHGHSDDMICERIRVQAAPPPVTSRRTARIATAVMAMAIRASGRVNRRWRRSRRAMT